MSSPAAPLILPWPAKQLSPNARVHWAVRSKAVKSARGLAKALTLEAGWHKQPLPEGRLHLWVTFYPPTRQLPDDDNMLARFKASRDGIAEALGIDDRRFVSHPFVHTTPHKGGRVVVRLSGGPEEPTS